MTKKDIISIILKHEQKYWADLIKAEEETCLRSDLSNDIRAKWLAIENLIEDLSLSTYYKNFDV